MSVGLKSNLRKTHVINDNVVERKTPREWLTFLSATDAMCAQLWLNSVSDFGDSLYVLK